VAQLLESTAGRQWLLALALGEMRALCDQIDELPLFVIPHEGDELLNAFNTRPGA
jgi:hypothetical protein